MMYQDMTRIAEWPVSVLVDQSLYRDRLERWPVPLQGVKLDAWWFAWKQAGYQNPATLADGVVVMYLDQTVVFEGEKS